LQEALHSHNLAGIPLGPRAPPIHSLLFAEAQAIKHIYVVKQLWKKPRQLNIFYMVFVINQVKLLTFINLIFI
jgi:hypothetical protein